MGQVVYFCSGAPYEVESSGEDGADASVPLFADSLDAARREIARSKPVGVEARITSLPFVDGSTMMVMYTHLYNNETPTVLLYIPDVEERIEEAFSHSRTRKKFVCNNTDQEAPDWVEIVAIFAGNVTRSMAVLADGSDVVGRVLDAQDRLRERHHGHSFPFDGMERDETCAVAPDKESAEAFQQAMEREGFVDGLELLAAYKALATKRVPERVRNAVLRMSQPIDPARFEKPLSATMRQDAEDMAAIRGYVLGSAA